MQIIAHRKHVTNLAQPERWASIAGGVALAALGLRQRTPAGFTLAAIGAELIRRGATGRSFLYEVLGVRTAPKGQGAETTSVPYELGIRVDKSVTINKPRAEVYRFWRNLENLPRFMSHLESVTVIDDKRSHWVAKAPAGTKAEWDAEINNEIENELIGWRSLEGADVDHAGSVQFHDAPNGRGTEVKIELQYNPPAGAAGAVAAKLFGSEPGDQIQEDLHHLKQILETGEVPTVEGQPTGKRTRRATRKREEHTGEVQYASEQSFPASDAPAFNR